MREEKEWYKLEDEKYSWLYANGYPKGNPEGLCSRFDIPSSWKAVDLGCGLGSLSNYFKNYTGIDGARFVVEKNQKDNKNGTYIHGSLHKVHELVSGSFDVAICADVMEHIPSDQVETVLQSIAKVDANRYAFAISTRPSGILDKDGGNLHLTIWTHQAWENALTKYFNIRVSQHVNNTTFIWASQK